MTIYWIYITVCFLAVVIALYITPLIKAIALKCNKLDSPNARKVHQQPMVRLGGVAVFVATLCAIGSTFVLFDFSIIVGGVPSAEITMVWLLIIGGAGFFLIGFADDLFDLSAVHRLWLQGLIAAVLWIFGLRIDTLLLPSLVPCSLGWWGLPITVLWIAGVVNAINWIDGLDGLAAGVSAIATAVIASLAISTDQPMVALIASALLGSLLGFLVYNYNPAEIFMGDGGSYFLGFMLASLCIVGPQQVDMPMASLLPLFILAVPIGDMTSVIAVRLYQRRSPFSADNLHIHHRLLNRELNYKTVVWVMYLLTFASGSLALTFAGVAGYFTLWTGSVVLIGFFIWQLAAQLKNQQVPQSKDSNVVVEKAIW